MLAGLPPERREWLKNAWLNKRSSLLAKVNQRTVEQQARAYSNGQKRLRREVEETSDEPDDEPVVRVTTRARVKPRCEFLCESSV